VTGVRIARHDGDAARALRPSLEEVVAAAFAGPPYFEDRTGGSPALSRFDAQTRRTGFALVTAEADEEPVGLAFGYTLPAATGWWDDVLEPVDDDMRREDGTRTFAVFELAVVPSWQRRGVAGALHRELLRGRAEERAILNCRPDALGAQAAYAAWGYRRVTSVVPWEGAPVYDVLVLEPLPAGWPQAGGRAGPTCPTR